MRKAVLASLLLALVLLGGCLQGGAPGTANGTGATRTGTAEADRMNGSQAGADGAGQKNATNTPAGNSSPPVLRQSLLEEASARLLESNNRFLNQTRMAEEAAGQMQFGQAARHFNQSALSAQELTRNLAEVCELKNRACGPQLEGYAAIAACAGERAGYYAQVDALVPELQLKLDCGRNETAAGLETCRRNDADYASACIALTGQAVKTQDVCQPVLANMTLVEASALLCPDSGKE